MKDKQDELDTKATTLQSKEDGLDTRKDGLDEREINLNLRENGLDKREKELDKLEENKETEIENAAEQNHEKWKKVEGHNYKRIICFCVFLIIGLLACFPCFYYYLEPKYTSEFIQILVLGLVVFGILCAIGYKTGILKKKHGIKIINEEPKKRKRKKKKS